MAFKLPNTADAPATDHPYFARPDSVDFDIIVNGMRGDAVLDAVDGTASARCAVTQNGGGDMSVNVAAGVIRSNGISKLVAAGNVVIAAHHATLDRIDLIVVDASGALQRRAGTAASRPVFPKLTGNDVALAAIYIASTTTTISSSEICDKRVYQPDDRGWLVPMIGTNLLGTSPLYGGCLACVGGSSSRTTLSGLFDAMTLTTSGTFTNANAVVTGIADTTGMVAGMPISGTKISGTTTTILSVDSSTQITMSANATSGGAAAFVVAPHGVGDGSTTFNIPSYRQRALIGIASSGTGVRFGETGGTIDHTHTSAAHSHSHTHTSAAHSHSHTHTSAAHTHTSATTDSTTPADSGSTTPGVTGAPNNTVAVVGGGATTPATGGHTHTSAAHTHTSAAHTHAVATATGSTTPGATGSDATSTTPGATGSDATSTTPGATGTANFPYGAALYAVRM